MLKILERLIKKKELYVVCKKCGKEIKGTAESQVTYNFKNHKCISNKDKEKKK